MRKCKYVRTKLLTFWCPLPGSSGCAAAPPTAGLPQCQKWKRQRSRGEGHFRAWAGCPIAVSPRSAYLQSGTKKKVMKVTGIFIFTTLRHKDIDEATTHIRQWGFACGTAASLLQILRLSTLTTFLDLVNLEPATSSLQPIKLQMINTQSDSLTLFYPVGFKLTASL